jgi:transcription initiation factor IIE alpha subunit
MNQNFLVCPSCQYPLDPPTGASTGMACPRCNSWLDIDPSCAGSCISCHKLHEEHSLSCVESEDEISWPVVVQR